MKFQFLFALLFLVFSADRSQAQAFEENPFITEKMSLGLGLGMDYAVGGWKFNYVVNEKIATFISTSISGTIYNNGTPPLTLGLEYRQLFREDEMFYGTFSFNRNLKYNLTVPMTEDEEGRMLEHFTLGFGYKKWLSSDRYNFSRKKKTYLSFGVSVSRSIAKFVREFTEDFNLRYMVDEPLPVSRLVPFINVGLHRNLK